MNAANSSSSGFSRRRFLGFTAAAAAAVPIVSACGSSWGSSGGSGELKFWDMPWGTATYNDVSKKIIALYKPTKGLPSASYQSIQWANFGQTFASAIASGTNPAVSTGGGFQAFQFAEQGAIAYADNLIETMKKDGLYDDFLPGTIDGMKTDKGYVAIPWELDAHVWWYNKALLEEAGAKVPTTWDELLATGKALKKIGVYGFSTGAGAGNSLAYETPMSMMIGNGGGLFDPDGNLDVLNKRNIEAIEFIKQLVDEGIVDPASVGYTNDNQYAQWKKRRYGLGNEQVGLADNVGGTVAEDLLVMSPIAGPHGDKATLVVENNVMMYKNTPSQEGSEALLLHWLKNMYQFWDQPLVNGLPVLKSIAESPEFQKRPNYVKMVKEYQPIGRSYAARGKTVGAGQSKMDGNSAMYQFGQAVLARRTDAKSALTTLSNALSSLLK
ncbi:ABC transporter substrate-binding protein [Streptomyces acidicola]|uniref:ABC transporter substrate-binding protein n=1 Tax=Streptomyces acidicola TaxID=2596892 RepID=UPI0034243E93